MLLQSAGLGFIFFVMFLILKRIQFHETPVPTHIIKLWLATLTTYFVIGIGVFGGNWGELFLKLFFIYMGFICFVYVVGDIDFYRDKIVKPEKESRRVYAPEDDENWPDY